VSNIKVDEMTVIPIREFLCPKTEIIPAKDSAIAKERKTVAVIKILWRAFSLAISVSDVPIR
jgi:hypothetical protein